MLVEWQASRVDTQWFWVLNLKTSGLRPSFDKLRTNGHRELGTNG